MNSAVLRLGRVCGSESVAGPGGKGMGGDGGNQGQSREGVEPPDCLVEQLSLSLLIWPRTLCSLLARRQQAEEAAGWVGGGWGSPAILVALRGGGGLRQVL